MSLISVLAGVMILIVCISAQRHSCYVCVSKDGSEQDVTQLFPQDTIPSCEHSPQAQICPDGYKGCLTVTKGSVVTMTCTLLVIDGCRSVNDVTYCYCKGELCNTVPLPAEETDDEDMTEGSGLTVTTTTVLPSYHNHTTVSTTSASFNRSSSPFTIFLLISLSAWR